MNLDPTRAAHAAFRPVAAPRPGPRQIDITSAEPAVPASQERGGKAQPADVAASIKGVLTADEERAIAGMFAASGGGYSRIGTATGPPAVPGLRLNLQA